MEYQEPLITADSILQLYIGENISFPHTYIYSNLGGKGNSNITLALNKLCEDDYLEKTEASYYIFTGKTKQFISDGMYCNWCNRIKKEKEYMSVKELLEIEQIKSTTKTNKSVQESISYQRKLGNRTLILGGITAFFIAVTIYQQYEDKTDQKLQDIQTELQKSKLALDSVRFSIQETNSSIQQPKTDTVFVKQK